MKKSIPNGRVQRKVFIDREALVWAVVKDEKQAHLLELVAASERT